MKGVCRTSGTGERGHEDPGTWSDRRRIGAPLDGTTSGPDLGQKQVSADRRTRRGAGVPTWFTQSSPGSAHRPYDPGSYSTRPESSFPTRIRSSPTAGVPVVDLRESDQRQALPGPFSTSGPTEAVRHWVVRFRLTRPQLPSTDPAHPMRRLRGLTHPSHRFGA